MDWTARLAERRAENPERASGVPTKLTKPAFVSFGSKQDGRSESIAVISAEHAEVCKELCDRLLALTAVEYRDPSLVRALSESFLRDLRGIGDDALRVLLSMLADDADRRALKQPKGDTAAILCRKCGPVWVHPSIAAVLHVVDGWPRALGCPWCFVHPKCGNSIPRPTAPGMGTGDSR